MKKIALVFSVLFFLSACENVKGIDYNQDLVNFKNPFDTKYYQGREKNYIFVPAYRTDIKTEKDYKMTELECRHYRFQNNNKSEYCTNELRWRRNYGDLQFLNKK